VAFLQPDILPAMAEGIHRQLCRARGGRLSRDALAELVVPAGLSKGPGGEKIFGDTLRELCSIGALVADAESVALPDEAEAPREPGAMRRIVRERTMAAELDSDLWEKDDAGSLINTGARDLVRAVAWFLSLNVDEGPFEFEKTDPALTELQQRHTGERPIFNVERWRPFVRWARYLGFVQEMSLYSGAGTSLFVLIPDPTRAVAAVLPQCVQHHEWTPLADIMPLLSERLPVVDGGVYRRSIHEKGVPTSASDWSSSMTLTFQRLSALELIELEIGAGDAPKMLFANNQGAYHALRWVGSTDG